MRKYKPSVILIEIAVMVVFSCIPTVIVALNTEPEKNLGVLTFILSLSLALILHVSLANVILFPFARKTLEKRADAEGFVRSRTFHNKESNSCASVLAIDEVSGRIAYVSVHNPFEFQTADVKDLTAVDSGYVSGPFGGTRYVYYQFFYRNKMTKIPTFTSRSMFSLSSKIVQEAMAKANRFRDSVLVLQEREMGAQDRY